MSGITYQQLKTVVDTVIADTNGSFKPFDASYYVATYQVVINPATGQNVGLAGYSGDPLQHYVEVGSALGLKPAEWFDAGFYRSQYADLTNLSAAELLYHYAYYGVNEGRSPNASLATFDYMRYLRENPDVDAFVRAHQDYYEQGIPDNPNYLLNGAVQHFMKFGMAELAAGASYRTGAYELDGDPITSMNKVRATDAVNAPAAVDGVTTVELNTNGGKTILTASGQTIDGDGGIMRLVGDADVRIDFTNHLDQVTGIDLDGDGTIENNGIENNISGKANGTKTAVFQDFVVVDAYARNLYNESDRGQNFLGDIYFDGTSYQGNDGDGVKTDGNIFLGGLGADIAKGGVGNDFLAGGGVAQGHAGSDVMTGDRNADFFFVELARLSFTDGNRLQIDGGNTVDQFPAGGVGNNTDQDSDWVLLEASDDDEPVKIVLADSGLDDSHDDTDPGSSGSDNNESGEDDQMIQTRAGAQSIMEEIENLDASGNLYRFLNGIDVTIGGRLDPYSGTGENSGLGSTAQLEVYGSVAKNIVIGGYDNDYIDGAAGNDLLMGGNLEYLKTYLNNPNVSAITNDGIDYLFGGTGNDGLVWELDKGQYQGGDGTDTLWITDWSTGRTKSSEAATVTDLITDERFRIDLGYSSYKGYRGKYDDRLDDTRPLVRANTADQTNYKTESNGTTITSIENVNATGLGDLDYKSAGSNSPELNFANQQNFDGSNVDMDLRGTDDGGRSFAKYYTAAKSTDPSVDSTGFTTAQAAEWYAVYLSNLGNAQPAYATLTAWIAALEAKGIQIATGEVLPNQAYTYKYIDASSGTGNNILYAGTGDDILEGRTGDDKLEGNAGNDDFYFQLNNGAGAGVTLWGDLCDDEDKDPFPDNLPVAGREGVDVIHRMLDANGDFIWDGTYGQDFGLDAEQTSGNSVLQIGVFKAGGNAAGDELDDVVNRVSEIRTGVKEAGSSTFTSIVLNTTAIKSATTYQGLTDAINVALDATAFGADLQATLVNGSGSKPLILITDAKGRELADETNEQNAGVDVSQKANTQTENVFSFEPFDPEPVQDRLIYKAYEDRKDNEGVDDDATFGSTISLGANAYAQDLVVDFAADGTRIAEDQAYNFKILNLAVEDKVTIDVNGVKYSLQVGKALDGTLIAGESNTAFLKRLAEHITGLLDDDTAAGAVNAYFDGVDTITLMQRAYNGEETVFMRTPTAVINNLSGGEQATVNGKAGGSPVAADNISESEVLLYKFDGRDGNLNHSNVLFVGEEFERIVPNSNTDEVSRAVLETAADEGATIIGDEAMVINVDNNILGQSDDVATAISLTPNIITQFSDNFAVHGDDLLIGGKGDDDLFGDTGDDRIRGSEGDDTVDGGKDLYLVTMVGQSKGTVMELNSYEAGEQDSDPDVLSVVKILQTENGGSLIDGFQDLLIFNQSDFGAVGAGGAQFYITMSDDLDRKNGGEGTVEVSVGGVVKGTTEFVEMEQVRTAAGDGTLAGQGHDTLDLQALSDAAGDDDVDGSPDDDGWDQSGVDYHLTDGREDDSGMIHILAIGYDSDDNWTNGEDALFAKVDGVENVIFGKGDDELYVDESEAGKDNEFTGGLGDDYLEYDHSDLCCEAAPIVTVTVEADDDVDTIMMTGGALGTDKPVDTIDGFEIIDVWGITQGGASEDVLDVSNINGVVVDFIAEEVRDNVGSVAGDDAPEDYADLWQNDSDQDPEDTDQYVALWGMDNIERTTGSSSADVVIIQDEQLAYCCDPSDTPVDLQFDTFMNYDTLDSDSLDRLTLADLRSRNDAPDEDWIPEATFIDLYQFNMGGGVDTIDYSDENGTISAVVNFDASDDAAGNPQRVMVDFDGEDPYDFDSPESDGNVPGAESENLSWMYGKAASTSDGAEIFDRVDLLKSVENIVAGQGTSILDLTNAKQNLSIQYSRVITNVDDLDRDVHRVQLSNLDTDAVLSMNFLEYTDAGNHDTGTDTITQDIAIWNWIEGSDYNEKVEFTDAESGSGNGDFTHWMNLRGGDNEANYNELTRSIQLTIDEITLFDQDEYDALDNETDRLEYALNQGYTLASVLATNGEEGSDLVTFDTDYIRSNNATNGIDAGSLRIEASQDQEDSVSFADGLDKVLLLGTIVDGSDVLEVRLLDPDADVSMFLTGFEFLQDASTDDVYTFGDLSNILSNFTFTDDESTLTNFDEFGGDEDIDTLKLTDDAFENTAFYDLDNSIFLEGVAVDDSADANPDLDQDGINNFLGMNFKVLDVSEVTDDGAEDMELNGSGLGNGDAAILGDLGLVALVTDFDAVWLSGNSDGDDFIFNVDTGEIQDGSGDGLFSFDGSEFNTSLIDDRDMTISVVDSAGVGVAVVAGDGDDTITGGAGDDEIEGGGGNDALDGGTGTEVRTIDLTGLLDANAANRESFDWMGQGNLTLAEAATADANYTDGDGAVVDGAGNSVVGAALAGLLMANLGQANTDFQAATGSTASIVNVSFDGTSLRFEFAPGEDVDDTDQIDLGASGTDGGTFALSSESVVSQGGSGGEDTFVFAATAAKNGVDTIEGFTVTTEDDVLDFTAFFGGSSPAALVSNGTSSIDNGEAGDVVLENNNGTAFTSTSLANKFSGEDVGQLTVVIEIDGTDTGEDAKVWFAADANEDGNITKAEVSLVGVISGAGDFTWVLADNFA